MRKIEWPGWLVTLGVLVVWLAFMLCFPSEQGSSSSVLPEDDFLALPKSEQAQILNMLKEPDRQTFVNEVAARIEQLKRTQQTDP